MDSAVYKPLEEFENKFKPLHLEYTNTFFDDLVSRSGVNIEANRETVRKYHSYKEDLGKLKKRLNLFRFLRVLMCITLLLIPLVIWKMTPKIRQLREKIEQADRTVDALLAEAYRQMLPLNTLFTDRDALNLVQKTLPLLKFEPCFSVRQEIDMKVNYDFSESSDEETSTLDVLAGTYNGNPFLFENKVIHTMGTETYHGQKTIYWSETYRDSDGKMRTRTRSQTLHASVTKPKPFYSTQVVLNYGSQGAPDLCFSRDASHLDRKSERGIERHVRRGERKLKRMTDRAIRENDDFTSMSNTDFEVLFDALDRTDEVQFRTLFTPLAQTNMVDLILSKVGYGDDFNFFKRRRMNRIVTTHSQGRAINLLPESYIAFSFDTVRENFVQKNTEYFKAVYFDFAPILSIPAYQERPVHSLKPIPDYSQLYSYKESEALANAVDHKYVVHPQTKTEAILKASFLGAQGRVEETCITAHSYDIEKRVDVVSVYGGDGHFHNVPVTWDLYIPLTAENRFFVTETASAGGKPVIARRSGLCIYPAE